jgi:hypothetical protein
LSSTDCGGACKSMNHAQKYLAQANRQIAELAVQLARQRVIVKHALDTGQRSEMAESLLNALERSLRIFEKHRIFLLSCSVNCPSKGESSKRPDPRGDSNRRVGTCHDATSVARHDRSDLSKKADFDSLIGSGAKPPGGRRGRAVRRVIAFRL